MQGNFKLQEKYEEDEGFRADMLKNEQNYQSFLQEAIYADLSCINEDLLIRLDRPHDQIYFYCAMHHKTKKQQLHKTVLSFFKHFTPDPKKLYSVVYLNSKAKSEAYAQFKEMFLQLSLPFFIKLENLIVLRPTFFQKAQDFVTFNILPSYLMECTHYVYSGKDLCSLLNIKPQEFVDLVPVEIGKIQFPNLKPRNQKLPEQRMNLIGQIRNESEIMSRDEFESTIKEFLFMKPGKQTRVITDYEMGRIGIPVVLQVLIFYFKTHPDGLLLEGLFRKSVSIDEENQTLAELANENYDCLLQITNAHIVANLIKRFFANLKVPVIPFGHFEKLMHDQGVKDKESYLKQILGTIPKPNFLSLMYLITFLKEDVIVNEEKNKMSAQNVAICFAPCLMRAEKASPQDLIYASKSAMATRLMIDKFDNLFGDEKERNITYRNSEKDQLDIFKEEIESSLELERNIRNSNKKQSLTPEKGEEKQIQKSQKQTRIQKMEEQDNGKIQVSVQKIRPLRSSRKVRIVRKKQHEKADKNQDEHPNPKEEKKSLLPCFNGSKSKSKSREKSQNREKSDRKSDKGIKGKSKDKPTMKAVRRNRKQQE